MSAKSVLHHLHEAGGLSAPRSDNAGAAGAVDGQVRPDAEEVPEGASQGTLLQPADELRPERASERHGAQSERDGTVADGADGSVGGRDGESESDGYDELGSEDEQYPEPGSGDRDGGGNLRLDYYDRSHEDKSLPFFGGDDTVREILGTTPHLKASKDEIRAFFEATADENARISYIKRIFNNDYTEVILRDGRRVGYKTYQNVLQLWEGSYLSRTAQSFYDWGVIAQHFEAMRLLGELQDTMKPLPSIDGQLSLMTAGAEERKPSAFTFSQEIIDAVLTRGSGISEGKMRIYEQFQKSLSAKENADFLKNEYGWGGVYPAITGAGIDEQHNGKGIRISKGIGSDKPHIDLKWSQVEKRIAELIKLDRYLNPKEKAQYPAWLQRQEERHAELAEERRNREILSTAPSEKTEPKNERYEYHLGSTVYLGANEYEILSFDDERVMLYDTQFPLFNKEMTRTEFDSKVQENPLNDHLKVAIKQPEEKAVEFDIGMGYLGNGLTVWNRAVEVNGDYQTIAHISPEGEITFYVQDLPQSVVERIRQAAEREKPKDAALPEFYQAYLKTKADNPSSLLLYQVGDFFEAYADDAEVVGTALDLTQTTRAVDHNTRVPMVGFPQHRLETYLTMLTDRGYDVAVNALEDGKRIKIIKFYPQEIARRSDVIAGLKSDMERVAEHPKPSDETFVGMTVKGAFCSEKADAGNAILEACKAMTNPDPIPLGEYRGFTMELYFEAREYKVRLKGELGYPVTLGTDTFGNITRLDNALEGLPKRLEMNEMELDNLKKQFETAKVDVERPFPQEGELKAKTDRLNELNALLNVDKRENEIVGGEPDEGEELPEKKPRDLER